MISRRHFLASLGSTAVVSAVAPERLIASSTSTEDSLWERWLPLRLRRRVDVADLVKSTFAPYLHTIFRVRLGSGERVDLKLIEVTDLLGAPSEGRFSLLFQGPSDHPFGQGIYEITHDQIGIFSIFVVPVGGNQEHAFCQAIFNRV